MKNSEFKNQPVRLASPKVENHAQKLTLYPISQAAHGCATYPQKFSKKIRRLLCASKNKNTKNYYRFLSIKSVSLTSPKVDDTGEFNVPQSCRIWTTLGDDNFQLPVRLASYSTVLIGR